MKNQKLILGNIVTLDMRLPILKAAVVKDGILQYVGSRKYAEALCDKDTEVLDYGENFIYPGYIEAHCHGGLAGPRLAFYANLNAGQTMEEYVQIMKDYMAKFPDNEFYYGAGWIVRNGVEPTAAMLDDICPDKAMALQSTDGHSIWFNTPAMEKFGINADAIAEWGTDIVRVNEDGTPTGYVSEGPVTSIMVKMGQYSDEDLKKALLAWQDFALSQGMTAYYEAGVNEHVASLYTELIEEGLWKIRVYAGYLIDERDPDYIAAVHRAKDLADKVNNEYFQIIGVKIFMDGVVEAHTAWLLEDYTDMPGHTGIRRCSDPERVTALYKEAISLGLNVHAHTIGDGAVHFALDCIEKAELATGNMDPRCALAHLEMVSPEDVKRLADLNVIGVVAPLWMTRDKIYEQIRSYIGERRNFYQYPMKSFLDNAAVLAFHTDFPVSENISMARSIYAACERNMPENDIFFQTNPHECISRLEALAGLTAGPAYSVKQEDHLGCLAIGYVANMSVFDKNFLEDPFPEIGKSKLIATVIDGEEVYHN